MTTSRSRPTGRRSGPRSATRIRELGAGIGAGALGAVAMSALMLPAGWLGVMGEQPPRRIVGRGAAATPPFTIPNERQRDLAAAALHLGIGAGAGAGFVPVADRLGLFQRSWPAVLAGGAAFGLAFWAISYTGIAPALDLLPPAPKDKPSRQAVLAAAHVVFGSSLAVGAGWLLRRD